MTASLLRRDPAFHRLPKWLMLTVMNVLVIAGLRAWIISARNAGETTQWGDLALLVLALWLPLSIYLIYVGHRPRYNRLDLGLPVAARQLWLMHLVAVVLGGLLLIVTASAVVELNSRGMKTWLGASEAVTGSGLLRVAPQFITVLLLAAVLYQSIQPAKRKLATDPQQIAIDLVLVGGLYGLLVVLCAAPLGWTLLPLGMAIFLAWRAYRDLPPAIDLVTETSQASDLVPAGLSDDSDAQADISRTTDGNFVLINTLVRTVYGSLKFLALFPLLVLIGLMLSSLLFSESGRVDVSLMYVPLIWYFLIAFAALSLKRLHLLDGWPVSRTKLFAMLVLPSMLILMTSYGLGHLLLVGKPSYQERIRYEQIEDDYFVMVPREYYEIAWNGNSPVIEAPWGETQEAYALPLLKGTDAVIYKPFTNGPSSSLDFVAWQISNAVQAIYGAEISEPEIKKLYLKEGIDGRVLPQVEMLTIAADHPELVTRWRGQWFPIVMVFVFAPWLLLLALYLRTFRAGCSTGRQRVTQVAIMVVSMALYIAAPVLDIADIADIRDFTGCLKILARHLVDSLPGGVFTLWILAAAVVFAAYQVALRRFQSIEFPLATARDGEC